MRELGVVDMAGARGGESVAHPRKVDVYLARPAREHRAPFCPDDTLHRLPMTVRDAAILVVTAARAPAEDDACSAISLHRLNRPPGSVGP